MSKYPLLFVNSIYELPHDKTNKMTCTPSDDSDQPGHPPSMTRVFAVHSKVAKEPSFLHADSEDSDGQADLSLRWARVILLLLLS